MGIISGPGSFAVQYGDHFRSGIISTSFPGLFPFESDPIQNGKALGTRVGSFAVPGSFAGPSNPVEGPTNFFVGLLRNCLNGVNCDPIMSSKQKKYKSNYVVSSPFDLKFTLSYNTPTLM